MCRNGHYRERVIKQGHGYGTRHVRIAPEFPIRIASDLGFLAVLREPGRIVTTAWDHIERIGRRSQAWEPRTVLVTGIVCRAGVTAAGASIGPDTGRITRIDRCSEAAGPPAGRHQMVIAFAP